MAQITHVEHGVRVNYKEVCNTSTGNRTGNYKRSGSTYFVICYDADGEVQYNEDFSLSNHRDAFIARFPDAEVTKRREQVTNL